MIDTILVAIRPDDRDQMVRLAEETLALAEPTDATVVLLHVFSEQEFEDTVGKLEFDENPSEVSPDTVVNRYTLVHDFIEELEAASVPFEARGIIGDEGQKIVEVAEEVGADRVLVGGRSRSPTGKALFGSVAQEVMLSSPCPVTFVRRELTE